MPIPSVEMSNLLVWAITGSVGALATVLWWLGRYGFQRLDTLTTLITDLRDDLHKDMAAIRERLAKVEGYLWPDKRL